MEYIKSQNTQSACTTREKETDRDTFFSPKKNDFPPKKNKKIEKNKKMPCNQDTGLGCPVALLAGFPSKVFIAFAYNKIWIYLTSLWLTSHSVEFHISFVSLVYITSPSHISFEDIDEVNKGHISFVNLVYIFRCSTTNPVCVRRKNLLVCSLPLFEQWLPRWM